MGRILLFAFLIGLGLWAYRSASAGPTALPLTTYADSQPERVRFVPIPVYVPPPRSNRTGSTNGPRVGGGGFSSGK
ncbi:MAG: hypothetical protein AAGI52_12085 [Bacteroidota bacterium]